MIDEPDEYVDSAIAKHILAVHRQQAQVLDVPYTMEQMQRYICFARSIRPQLTPEVHKFLLLQFSSHVVPFAPARPACIPCIAYLPCLT